MSSAADELRQDNLKRVAALSPAERVELAFELGELDLEIFCTHQGLSPTEARKRIRVLRQRGRRFSISAGASS